METRHHQRLYLLMISIHGLIRGHDLELGRDADTGGQTQYVVDLARALGHCPEVGCVDLITQKIAGCGLSEDYARPVEELSGAARIVRIDAACGKYLPKEQLWDHLDSFLDNLLTWLHGQPRMPDAVHSHYPDAGYVAVRLANLLGIPLIHTGHSLGRDKRRRLLASGITKEEIEKTYNIARRIAAEEETLANADLVITSTKNEVEEQYVLYNYYNPQRMVVIPPGTDLDRFRPPAENEEFPFANSLQPFFRDPGKPIVLALSRPDERKNLSTLVEAYGRSEALQQAANLLIIAGNRSDIRDLGSGARHVLTELLLAIDTYDLYGKVAIPKQHCSTDVPEIYRMVMASRGVFINPALTEPFGLTLLEAAASGLPVVATRNGGPVDILAHCGNGILVDPLDPEEIARALLKLLLDRESWLRASGKGLRGVHQHYTWQAHAKAFLESLNKLQGKHRPLSFDQPVESVVRYRECAIFTELDQSLLGDPAGLREFVEVIRMNRKRVIFGIATARRFDSALAVMNKNDIPRPDVLISSLGTRIHYGRSLSEDAWWSSHVDHNWNRKRIVEVLENQPGISLQDKTRQDEFKISYHYDTAEGLAVDKVIALLHQHELTANVIFSFGHYIDIIPSRASKGQALRYVALRLDIPLNQVLVAGGSGADEDMMKGNTLAVVVANRHREELSQLVNHDQVYYSNQPYARGILDAMRHYGLLAGAKAEVA
jgi:sucrose-phosphate synthase